MVKPKNETEPQGWLQKELERINRLHPIVATRFSVQEITPSKRIHVGDGHGGIDWDWTREERVTVSPYFDTKAEAVEWLDAHEPDENKHLIIRQQNKRRTITESWW